MTEPQNNIESIRDKAYELAFPHVKVKDPLSEVTRRERRSLLAVSIIALVIAKVGLIPEEITAFGIQFQAPDKNGLISVLVLVIGFYLVAFLIYAFSDFIIWRLAHISELRSLFKLANEDELTQSQEKRLKYLEYKWNRFSTPTSVTRAIFEFFIPVVVGVYAIVMLLSLSVQ